MTAEEIENLIKRSSLASADARRLRARATPEMLDQIRLRKNDYSLTQASEIRNSIEESADRYRVAETADRLLGNANGTAKEICQDLVPRDRRTALDDDDRRAAGELSERGTLWPTLDDDDRRATAELSERGTLLGHLSVILNAAFRDHAADRGAQRGSDYFGEVSDLFSTRSASRQGDVSSHTWLHSMHGDDALAELDDLALAFFYRRRAAKRVGGAMFYAWPEEPRPLTPRSGTQWKWSGSLNNVRYSAIRRDDILIFAAKVRPDIEPPRRREADHKEVDHKSVHRRIALLEVAFDLHGAILATSSVPGVPTGVAARTAALAGAALENVKAACERPDYFMSGAFVEGAAGWKAVNQLSRAASSADLLRQELAQILKVAKSSLQDSIHEAGAWCRSPSVEGKSGHMTSAATLFFGLDLGGTPLAEADFTNINLVGVDFAEADLTAANFSGSDLTGANLNGACIADAIWSVTTVWPEEYGGRVKAMSRELEAGVYLVCDDGERVTRDAVFSH